ncbi:MAG: hypothetical protein ACXAC8_12665 [Candidatus Hodarchaeales archaeon]|jgi:hypothetical protein
MKKNPWFERGVEELQKEKWFDGFQMLQGSIQRAFRNNDPGHIKTIISKTLPILIAGNQTKLGCDLVISVIMTLNREKWKKSWIELIPFGFSELRKGSLDKCVRNVCNKIMNEKAFQKPEFLSQLEEIILDEELNPIILADLNYVYAGLLCNLKEFSSCFDSLYKWSKSLPTLSPEIRAYLSLAELNAYEIEGSGKYFEMDSGNKEKNQPLLESQSYLEIAARIFRAVNELNHSEFHSTMKIYSNLINPKNDGLLFALCNGISDIFKNKSGTDLFSLFKT